MTSERSTPTGLEVEPFLPDAGLREPLEAPGVFPFGRGIFPNGYRESPWMESFASGFGLPETTNRHQHLLRKLGHGGYADRDSMNLVFDRPTFEGFDSDHPLARHEVGEVGVLVDSVHDIGRIFEGFDLEGLNVGIILDRSGPPVFAMYLALVPPAMRKLESSFAGSRNWPWNAMLQFSSPRRSQLWRAAQIADQCWTISATGA